MAEHIAEGIRTGGHDAKARKISSLFTLYSSLFTFYDLQQISKGGAMGHIIGILWYRNELAYRRALEVFTDSHNMPATFENWKTIVKRELEEIKNAGNIALRVDFDPETFVAFLRSRGFQPNSQAREAFAEHVVLEYQKTGKGAIIE